MAIIVPRAVPPHLGMAVHYRSYGTPGGEHQPRCRHATITEVGAWVDERVEPDPTHDYQRTVYQLFDTEACWLRVDNPQGEFLNLCRRDRLPPADRIAAGERTEHLGGHYHTLDECRDSSPGTLHARP